MRIVSLLPSATDIVEALGAAEELVGVSHSCSGWDHLPALTSTRIDTSQRARTIDEQVKEAASPLYDLDEETLEALAPDVIISQSLCDVCAVATGDVEAAIANLSSKPALVNLAPFSLADIPKGFADVGSAIGRPSAAGDLTRKWHQTLESYQGRFNVATKSPLRVAFLDWTNPPFAAGHWIPNLLEWIGCQSALAEPGQPSHEVTWDTVRAADADIVVAACCGLTQGRAQLESTPIDVDIQWLDGYELFSRPSPRLLDSVEELSRLLARHMASAR